METPPEVTEAHPSLHGNGNRLAFPTAQETSHHLPIAQASPGRKGSKAGGRCPSGRGFFKRKCPLWLKSKGPANSPQGLAVSKSRLCLEATHESPIQAVRKPPPQREALGLDSAAVSAQGKAGASLLRKLLCLKARKSRLKKPPLGLEASPLQRASRRPVTALSRTADPHGESPLRWKPRAEAQRPEESGSLAMPENAGTADQLATSWLAKPWRTFKTIITTRVRKEPTLSGKERNQGAPGESVLCLPAEQKTPPAHDAKPPIREQQSNTVAAEDKTPSSAPPSEADELYAAQKDGGGHGTPQRRLETHRRVGSISKPIPQLPGHEENGCCKDNPILEAVSELEAIQTKVCNLPGGNRPKTEGTGTENKGPKQEEDRHWSEMFAGEDLAVLAENPGGQGMVMATGNLGWLDSEELGRPMIRQKVEGKTAILTRSKPNTQGIGEESIALAANPRHSKCSDEQASGVSPAKASSGSCIFPPALSENVLSGVVISPPSGISAAEGALYPTFSEESCLPTPLEPCPAFSSRVLERAAEGRPTSTLVQTPGKYSPPPQRPQYTKEPHGVVPWLGTAGPEEDPKHSIYMAAVEIVESAIDAAAEQVARKREQEGVGHSGQPEAMARSAAGAAMGEVDG